MSARVQAGSARFAERIDEAAAEEIVTRVLGIIVLATTHEELVKIEKAVRTAAARHNEFLKELGLPLLPLS